LSQGRYTAIVLLTLLLSTCLWAALVGARLERAEIAAALLGGAVAALNALASHALALRAGLAPTGRALRLVLGGMTLRLVAVLSLLAVGLGWLELPAVPLLAALLGHFVLFLGFEFLSLQDFWKARPIVAVPGELR
jgi:hypothetical protein